MAAEYVLGFLFTPDHKNVLLYQKAEDSPLHAGKWNGVGGKIEHGETPKQAMNREGIEEAGLKEPGWIHYGALYGSGFYVYLFRAVAQQHSVVITAQRCMLARIEDVMSFAYPIVPNLPMLIGAAIGDSRPELWQDGCSPNHQIREN